MDWESFREAYAASQVAREAYVAGHAEWVRTWMAWMGLAFAPSVIFAFFRVEARWVLLSLVLTLVTTEAIGLAAGWNKLWGLAHIIWWTPLVIYLVERRSRLRFDSMLDKVHTSWLWIVGVTMTISLAFDVVDVARYFIEA